MFSNCLQTVTTGLHMSPFWWIVCRQYNFNIGAVVGFILRKRLRSLLLWLQTCTDLLLYELRPHNDLGNIRTLSKLFLLLFHTLFCFPLQFTLSLSLSLSLLFSSVSMFLSIFITFCSLLFIQFCQPSDRCKIFPSTCVFLFFHTASIFHLPI